MRSKWKGVYANLGVDEKTRQDTVLPADQGRTVKVSTGKELRSILVQEGHIGKKYGSLVMTKKSARYKKKGE